MPRAQRHLQLLEVAGELVRAEGWSALSMRALAREAGVSRQTLYDHFTDAEALTAALVEKELEQLPSLDDPLSKSDSAIGERLRDGVRALLRLPRDQRRVLRVLAAGLGPEGEVSRLQLQQRMASRWAHVLSAMTGLGAAESRAVSWGLIAATLSLAEAVDDGLLGPMSAQALAVSLVTGAIQQLWDDGQ